MRTLVPRPSIYQPGAGQFQVTAATVIHPQPGSESLQRIGRLLARWIGTSAAKAPPRVDPDPVAISGDAIVLELGEVGEPGDEAYELTIAPGRVVIRGRKPAGVFYGVQTFRQLLPAFVEYQASRPDASRPVRAGAAHIIDSPRYAWRGAMLDVARHFFAVDDVKRFVDLMALHKLNRLHLHLTDDQGWRIEIKSWPNLTSHGGSTAVGGGPGGYYTQSQYSELVDYAADRAITIVPELDMPAHTNAALASYPELNPDGVARQLYSGTEVGFVALPADRDITYKFVDDVVREVSALTPGAYFHIGADEVRTLSGPDYVQFVERAQAIVASYGKQMVGWDEVAAARLLPSTIVQHWRPDAPPVEAAANGARMVMSVANRAYLDMQYDRTSPIGLHWAGYVGVRDAYDWDPSAVAAGIPESAILGVEAPLWSETAATMRDVEWLAFPRLAAIAEVAWSRARPDWDDFGARLAAQAARWSALGINFHRSPAIRWEGEGTAGQE